MYCYNIVKKMITFCCIILIFSIVSVEAEVSLTLEEKAYIEKSPVIKAASVDGSAPLQFADERGEVQGISKRVLAEISEMTGLMFEYSLYDSVEEALKSDSDIVFGFPHHYTPDNVVLSNPFLKSETILYINKSMDSNYLDNKIYAAVKGSDLPEGIKEENTLFYNTREESMNAVEKGRADYGYGNAYSVAYYTLKNDYKNIVTIPKGKESREYCIGMLKNDKILLSIINKSISSIDADHMQNLILDVTSHIEREITYGMVLETYGRKIFAAIFIIISILLFSVISNLHTNKKLRVQNKKYEVLSGISNEYLYEYNTKTDHLELFEKSINLFESQEFFNNAVKGLKDILLNNSIDDKEIKLPLGNGKVGVFKAINSKIYDNNGKIDSIIGKLIDISEETAEKEELLKKSQTDGLTNLYNAATTKELITERIKRKDINKTDAFILLDCDDFKDINDTLGHLAGNQILKFIGDSLKAIFRSTDIIGRIGGDEFCVYIKDIPSDNFARQKCEQLIAYIKKTFEKQSMNISISIGISPVGETDTYESAFMHADNALYEAKRRGKSQVFLFGHEFSGVYK